MSECASFAVQCAHNENAVVCVYTPSSEDVECIMEFIPECFVRTSDTSASIGTSTISVKVGDVLTSRCEAPTHAIGYKTSELSPDFYYQYFLPLSTICNIYTF